MKEWFRISTLLWLVMAGLALFSVSLVAAPAEAIEQVGFETEPGDILVVENDYGRVRVTVGESSRTEVRVRKIAANEANLENIYVLSQKISNKIFVRAFFYDYQSESLYLNIKTPAFTNIVVWGINPAVEVAGIAGRVRVHTITGFITAENLLASSSLATEEGSINYSCGVQPSEDIRLETARGSINCRAGNNLNLRSWLRAGSTLSWNDEVVLSPGQLEKQLGVGGPLILATSQEGNVTFRLQESVDSAIDRLPASDDRPAAIKTDLEEPGSKASADPNTGRLSDSESGSTSSEYTPVSSGEQVSSGGYSLKVNVDWVYVNASVRDRYSNRAVADLREEDFEVYEDGELQKIEKFVSNEAPFSLLLLLDVSGSTKSYKNMIRDSSIQFTEQIKESDQIAVATFNSRPKLIHDFTNDRHQIRKAINRIRSGGGTAFYDALDRSVRDYMDGVEGRKAIVVFSDGVDNQLTGDFGSGSRITFNDLYREVQEADILIYTIFLDTEGQIGNRPGGRRRGGLGGILGDIIFKGPTIGIPGPGGGRGQDQAYEQARREMELIADQTGGRMYAPRASSDLAHVYSEIADDLRVQYTLAYQSMTAANDGQWREIEVKVINRPDLAVRARRGYYGRSG